MTPKILLIDIETAPDVAYVWGVYETNAIEIKEHWYILSAAWQWYKDGGIQVKGLPDYLGYKPQENDDYELCLELRELLDQADIVVAHNGADFDVKKINARFIYWQIPPPSPFKVVDTKRDLAKVAKFSSNRLNWLSKQLGLGSKTQEHQDFSLWKGCMAGDAASWKKMLRYNANDVSLLRKLYDEIAPYIPQPNVNLWRDAGIVCVNPACGSKKLQRRGTQPAKGRVYQRYQCTKCGKWTRDNKAVKTVSVSEA